VKKQTNSKESSRQRAHDERRALLLDVLIAIAKIFLSYAWKHYQNLINNCSFLGHAPPHKKFIKICWQLAEIHKQNVRLVSGNAGNDGIDERIRILSRR